MMAKTTKSAATKASFLDSATTAWGRFSAPAMDAGRFEAIWAKLPDHFSKDDWLKSLELAE